MEFKVSILLVVAWFVPLFASDLGFGTCGDELEAAAASWNWHSSGCTGSSEDVTGLFQTWMERPKRKKKNSESISTVVNMSKVVPPMWHNFTGGIRDLDRIKIMLDLFDTFDANHDNKISLTELAPLADFVEHGGWTSTTVDRLMSDLDKVVNDSSLQRAEFFFWFAWPTMHATEDMDAALSRIQDGKTIKKALQEKKSLTAAKGRLQSNASEDMTPAVQVPSSLTPSSVRLTFNYTEYENLLKLEVFFNFFDSNRDNSISPMEFNKSLQYLELQKSRNTSDIISALDLDSDGSVQRFEYYQWFTLTPVDLALDKALEAEQAKTKEQKSKTLEQTIAEAWSAKNNTLEFSRAEKILNAFAQADITQDGLLSIDEITMITNYISPGDWNLSSRTKLMNDLDKLVPDGFLQRAEFFYWFEWPDMYTSLDLTRALDSVGSGMDMVKQGYRGFMAVPERKVEYTIVPAEDIVNMFGGCFGNSDYQASVRILMFFSYFDSNRDNLISVDELKKSMTVVEPEGNNTQDIQALMKTLDTSGDFTLERTEFFRWFSPQFNGTSNVTSKVAKKTTKYTRVKNAFEERKPKPKKSDIGGNTTTKMGRIDRPIK